jgi:hypothetical protein
LASLLRLSQPPYNLPPLSYNFHPPLRFPLCPSITISSSAPLPPPIVSPFTICLPFLIISTHPYNSPPKGLFFRLGY